MTAAPKLPEGLEPVAWRVDWPAEIGIAPDRFYGADDAHRMNCHISYVHGAESPVVVPLVRLSDAQAALLARAAEKDALLAEASRLLKRCPPATMGMYVGRDRKSFGAQAKDLAAAIDSALLAAKEAKQ